MRFVAGFGATLLLIGASFGDVQFGAPRFGTTPKAIPDRVVVSFKRTPSYSEFRSVCAPYGDYVDSAPSLGFYVIGVANGQPTSRVIAALKKNPLIATADPDYYCEFCLIPNDTYWGNQWDKVKINAPLAWDYTLGSPDSLIAFTDTGFLTNGVDKSVTNHEDLVGQFDAGWNVYANNNNLADDLGHGTKVAGYAAAKLNNGLGVAGLAPNCRYMMVKVNFGQTVSTTNVANGIQYAIDHGARVISTSIISFVDVPVLKTAAANAIAAGVVLCAAAGNNNNTAISYPAGYPSVLGVAMTYDQDQRGWNSSYGTWCLLAAPGQNVWSCDWTAASGPTAYSLGTGTSYASPQVAAEAGMIYAMIGATGQRTLALADEVRSIIKQWVAPVSFTLAPGGGRIDVGAAILNTYVTVTGTITPGQYVGPLAGLQFDIQLRSPGNPSVVETQHVALDSAGKYTARFLKKGTFDVVVTGNHWLKAGIPNQTVVRGSQTLDFALVNGDATRDNVVDLYDLTTVLGDFGLTVSPFDLDGDSACDLDEINIVLINFAMRGF